MDQGDSKGRDHEEAEEEQFPDEERKMAERAHRPIGTARHLAVRHRDWASDVVG